MDYKCYGTPPPQNRGGGYILFRNFNAAGSSFNRICRFATLVEGQSGDYFEYVDSAAFGASFTVKIPGYYFIKFARKATQAAGPTGPGISRNATPAECSTSIASINENNILDYTFADQRTVNEESKVEVTWMGPLNAGDVIRPHVFGGADVDVSTLSRFEICFVRPL